jgi:glutaredoxin-related protein
MKSNVVFQRSSRLPECPFNPTVADKQSPRNKMHARVIVACVSVILSVTVFLRGQARLPTFVFASRVLAFLFPANEAKRRRTPNVKEKKTDSRTVDYYLHIRKFQRHDTISDVYVSLARCLPNFA